MLKEIKMKKIIYLLVLALMPMCFTACGGDDDSNSGSTNDSKGIVGLWEMIHIKGVTDDDEGNLVEYDLEVNPSTLTKVEELDVCDYVRYRFDQGNAFTCYTYNGSGWVDDNTATWRYSDDILTLEHSNYKDEMRVLSLTEDRLVLYEKVNDSHESYELTATFKRVE